MIDQVMTTLGGEEAEVSLKDGRRLGFAEYGDPGGMPCSFVIFVPGSGFDRGVLFARHPAALAGIRLVAVDRPGCGHLDQIRDVARGSDGCEQCLALGDSWVHLRMCMTCGQVGCCDSSKNRHAHRHADQVGNAIARSVEPGEDWMWCFIDSTMVQAARS